MKQKYLENMTIFVIVINFISGFLSLVTSDLFKSMYIKILALAIIYVIIILLLANKSVEMFTVKKPFKIILIFLLMTLVNFIFLLRFSNEYGLGFILNTFFTYLFYWFFIVIFLLKYIGKDFNSRKYFYNKIKKSLYFCAIIAYGYAFIQMKSNGLITYLKYNTLNRLESYFLSAYDFGIFINIVFCTSFSAILFDNDKKKIINYIMCLLSLIFVYTTFTRNIYMIILISFMILLFIKFGEKAKIIKVLLRFIPYILLAVVCITLFKQLDMNSLGGYSAEKVSDLTSVNMRLNTWNYTLDQYLYNNSIINILFGTGIIQTETISSVVSIVLDNSFLGIFLYQGIVQFGVFIVMYIIIWEYFVSRISKLNYFEKAFISLFGSYLPISMLNNLMYGYSYLIIIIGVMYYYHSDKNMQD